jgi:hypothetical protein
MPVYRLGVAHSFLMLKAFFTLPLKTLQALRFQPNRRTINSAQKCTLD